MYKITLVKSLIGRKPYVDQGKCRYIEDVVTPWPCFVVAVRTEIAEKYKDELQTMLEIVNKKALAIKNHEGTPGMLSWRYGQKLEDVIKWLDQTEWNYDGREFNDDFANVIEYLLKLKLVTAEQAENYQSKLFLK